jgi:thiol-disulfide isomerase/thioredoxin
MSSEDVEELDDLNWEKQVEKADNPVVVMFYSDSCAFCKQMEPHFFDYAGEFKDKIMFSRVNVVESPTIASRYGVMGTPTFKFFCKGKPVQELTGAIYPSLLKKAVEENLEHGESCATSTTWSPPDITGYA